MGSLNKAILIGNLGRDAELRYTPGGQTVASFNIATSETWNDKETGERKERTEWHRIVLWGKAAESLADYLKKGKQVCVEGRIQTRKWQDKDGNDRYTTEIRCDRLTLLGGGAGGRRVAEEVEEIEPVAAAAAAPSGGSDLTDDDIPFAWLTPLIATLLGGAYLA